MWWYISIILATWKAETGGSQSEVNPGKSMRSYLKNKLKAKGQET
jgi:hypothetical protein